MNIKPVTATDPFQVAASNETRDDAREQRSLLGQKKSRTKKSRLETTPVTESRPDATSGDDDIRASQTIDSESLIELLHPSHTVKLHAAKAFKKASLKPSHPQNSFEKKLDKAL